MAPNMPMVTDPGQNQAYIINGFYNYSAGVDRVVGAMRYDPSSKLMSPMLASTRLDLNGGYAVVWSTYRNFVLAFGGFVRGTTSAPSTYSQTLFQFNPQNPQFLTYETTNAPSARYAHCMVEAYGGSQIILYGGADDNEGAMSDLHILDMESKTWKLQKVDNPPIGRAYPCCAVTNDMFVAWSGARWDKASKQFKVLTDDITIVFNLKTRQWQDSFSPEPYVIPTQTATTTSVISPTTTTTVPRELPAGDIAGAVIGGLALLLAIAGGVFWLRVRKVRNQTWTWSTLWNRRNRPPSMEKRNLAKAAATPAGSNMTDDTLWSGRSSHGGDDYGDDDYHSNAGYKHESITSDKSAISGYGFRIGRHNFVQLESANSSEAGPIFQMVTIHNPTEGRPLEGEQDQDVDQDLNEPLMSPTTVRLIPISPTSPVNSANLPSGSIMSIATAFASSPSAPGQLQTLTGSSLTVVSSELDDQWAAAAVALAKEGQTRVERGERRNPHGPIQKTGLIDTLDLKEYESMPVAARNPHVLLEE
ncbi:hypothetical protein EC991_009469 [Linnemannia zychae]|nr:hypothetical protein EC991_009469 [Linnemannia zychae]